MFSTYLRLRVPVLASEREVIRAAQQRIAKHHRTGPSKAAERKVFYRQMLRHHHDARALLVRVH